MSTAITNKKEGWITQAEKILGPYMHEQSREYAESLYQTYVIENGDDWTPEAAVEEDMSYWEAE